MFSTTDSFHDIPEKYTHFLAFNALTVSHFSVPCNQIYRPPALLRWPHLLERRTPYIFIKVSGEERKMTATCGMTLTVFPHFALQESCTFCLYLCSNRRILAATSSTLPLRYHSPATHKPSNIRARPSTVPC